MARSGPISLNRVKPRKTWWKTHDISIWNSPDPAWGARALRRRVVTLSDVAHRKAHLLHLRASARPDLKRWGHRGAPKGHMSGVQRGPTVPPSPYRLGSIASWESISAAAPAGRVVRKEYVYTVHVPHTLHDTVLHRPHDCADGAHARAAPSDTPSREPARLRRRRRRLSLSSPQETGSRRSSDPLKAARYSGRAASSLSSPPTTTRGRGSELALTPGEAASAAGRAAHAAPLPPPAAGL